MYTHTPNKINEQKEKMIQISFTLDGIPYAEIMFLNALRKKLHTTFLLLKTHATPTPAHFKQNMPQKCQERKIFPYGRKIHFPSLGNYFSVKFISWLFFVFFLLASVASEAIVKHSLHLEIPSKVKEMAFDSPSSIIQGVPSIFNWWHTLYLWTPRKE